MLSLHRCPRTILHKIAEGQFYFTFLHSYGRYYYSDDGMLFFYIDTYHHHVSMEWRKNHDRKTI